MEYYSYKWLSGKNEYVIVYLKRNWLSDILGSELRAQLFCLRAVRNMSTCRKIALSTAFVLLQRRCPTCQNDMFTKYYLLPSSSLEKYFSKAWAGVAALKCLPGK